MTEEPIVSAFNEILYEHIYIGRDMPQCMACSLLLLEVMVEPDYATSIHLRLRKLLTLECIEKESLGVGSALRAGAQAVDKFGNLPRALAKPEVDHRLRVLRRFLS